MWASTQLGLSCGAEGWGQGSRKVEKDGSCLISAYKTLEFSNIFYDDEGNKVCNYVGSYITIQAQL